MIEETLSTAWKMCLARDGDPRVFGKRRAKRRKLTDDEAIKHFAGVWTDTLEPELRRAPEITMDDALPLVEGGQRDYVKPVHQYRWILVNDVAFVARLNQLTDETGTCDQLWPIAAPWEKTRLCISFRSITDKYRFERLWRNRGLKGKDFAFQLVMEFMEKENPDKSS